MTSSSAQIFSDKAAAYATARPQYPNQILDLLKNDLELARGAKAADVGSGTGIFSKQLLDAGYEVYGVEPNDEMRSQAEKLLCNLERFHNVAGSAEHTLLDDDSVDFITCAQAFHWFRPIEARQEFKRIMKPGGWVVLIWNGRAGVQSGGFESALEKLLSEFKPEVKYTNDADDLVYRNFFGAAKWMQKTYDHAVAMDLGALEGLVLSRSYMPKANDPRHERVKENVAEIFHRFETKGHVSMPYLTEVTFAQLA